MALRSWLRLLPLVAVPAVAVQSIDDFGARPSDASLDAALANGLALYQAAAAANSSAEPEGRVVLIPAGRVYTMLPHDGLQGLVDVEIRLLGTLEARTSNTSAWPQYSDGGSKPFLRVSGCSNVRLTGNGLVDGQGYSWWWEVVLTRQDNRPNLVEVDTCRNFTLQGWNLKNSMQFHVIISDSVGVLVEDVDVEVDVEGQADLLGRHGLLLEEKLPFPKRIPMFPLNTDGIDVSGRDIEIRNCRVTNFDDAVCVKPSHQGYSLADCTENVFIHDIHIKYGVGATVGSVPPNSKINCVRHVVFRDIYLERPLKAIYVKPNPGDVGSGIIDDVLYENIYAKEPLWWSIWVSTQQQHQPDDIKGTGCSFFYPLPGTKCPTQPRVPVTRLVLRNVTMVDALLSPGVLRCDPAGPCSGWRFEHVRITSKSNWPVGAAFDCSAIEGSTWVDVEPPLDKCFGAPSDPGRLELTTDRALVV